jgi:RNA polymerase sigma-70 factor (ECF subfamily)
VGPTDAEVVGRVLAGDVDAFGVLVERYQARGARFAQHMLGDADDAEEALQDALVRAYRSLHRCRDPERFGAWFMRILVNRCRTRGARRKRRERTFVRDEAAVAAAAGQAGGSEWREEIERALARLPSLYREAFLLRHVEGLSYEEMSGLLGARVPALKMRVLRACDKLRVMLEESVDV